MILTDIEKMIENSETRFIEYKQSIAELDKLGKAICGFLNVQGGVGLLGVTDKRKIVGIEVTESTRNKLSSFCNQFDPWPDLHIEYISIEGTDKQVVVIKATPRKDEMPFAYKGSPYLRNEAQLKKMPVEIYKQRLLKSAGISEAWESMPAPSHYTIHDLDAEEILKTMNVALKEERIPASIYTKDIQEALISLDVLNEDNKLTNAAITLFAKKMPSSYPQCFIRMGRFIDETMNNTLDSRQIRGNAFQLLDEAETFVKKHLPITSRHAHYQMERIDEPALPFAAVREAIINSLVHRDYSNRAGDIALLIFNTHLEIHNIGHLYADMTVSRLKKRHPSRRRNPKIAHVFHARKLIERYGGGTLRMIELCEQQGLQPPEFHEASDGFLVKFYFKTPIGPPLILPNNQEPPVITMRQRDIILILEESDYEALPVRDIVEQLENAPSSRTVGDDLAQLKILKFVDSSGIGRGAKWFLNNEK
jgi:ATP-dependent DNA helicase RecG